MFTIEEFQEKFAEIKNQSWTQSVRRGPTGIGQTLEQLLGLTENNIALPDLHEVELKAHRIGSTSMITLFTFNRKAWRMKPIEAIRKYGTPDINGRMGLYFTMSPTPNSTGLFLFNEENAISVRHISGEVIAEWQLDALAEQFCKKIPGLVLVSAFSEMRADIEWFQFSRAQLLTDTSPEIIREQILAGNVLVDLRLHDKGTSARNHGTGFRVKENKLNFLFKNVREL
jgi:MvaI/BcnI restriction endonuclease family